MDTRLDDQGENEWVEAGEGEGSGTDFQRPPESTASGAQRSIELEQEGPPEAGDPDRYRIGNEQSDALTGWGFLFDFADDVAAGGYHSCVRMSSRTVRCWGANTHGQLGIGWASGGNQPKTVAGLTGVDEVAAGQLHSCARKGDGTVWCWGNNRYGQLGDGTHSSRSTPVRVQNLTNAIEITAGAHHNCALLEDDTVRCWGRNDEGQLGNGATQHRNTPVTVLTLPVLQPTLSSTTTTANMIVFGFPLNDVVGISAGSMFTCAALGNGTARCWGGNFWGQLGDGTNTRKLYPSTVENLTTVTAVGSGQRHACALLGDGQVRCWGFNGSGQHGNGTTTSTNTPGPAMKARHRTGSTTVVSGASRLAVGSDVSCAEISSSGWGVSSERRYFCAGYGGYGQIPGPPSGQTKVAREILLGPAWGLSVGLIHSCGLLRTGVATCFGNASRGRVTSIKTSPAATSCPTGRDVEREATCEDEVWDLMCVNKHVDEFSDACWETGRKDSYPFVCFDDWRPFRVTLEDSGGNCYGFSAGCGACYKDPADPHFGYYGDGDANGWALSNRESIDFFTAHGWLPTDNPYRECNKRKACSMAKVAPDVPGGFDHLHSINEVCDGGWEGKMGQLWRLLTDQWGLIGSAYGGLALCYERWEFGANRDACAPDYDPSADPLNEVPFSCSDPDFGPHNPAICE